VDFTVCTAQSISLQMRDEKVTDEFSIIQATLKKKWFMFSQKKQILKVYSRLDQNAFYNTASNYFTKITIIKDNMENINTLFKTIQKEISEYDPQVDT
jgi:hypothetical protein